jgi:hypothetical protein
MCPHTPCGDSENLALPNKNRRRMDRALKACRKYDMGVRTAAGRYGVAKEISDRRIEGRKDKLGNISRT